MEKTRTHKESGYATPWFAGAVSGLRSEVIHLHSVMQELLELSDALQGRATQFEEFRDTSQRAAAGPWHGDLSDAPSDGRPVLLVTHRGDVVLARWEDGIRLCGWRTPAGSLWQSDEVAAWAEVHLPTKEDQ